ncbi:12676_t:CDS:2, partial [Dentiscutata heterogama]
FYSKFRLAGQDDVDHSDYENENELEYRRPFKHNKRNFSYSDSENELEESVIVDLETLNIIPRFSAKLNKHAHIHKYSTKEEADIDCKNLSKIYYSVAEKIKNADQNSYIHIFLKKKKSTKKPYYVAAVLSEYSEKITINYDELELGSQQPIKTKDLMGSHMYILCIELVLRYFRFIKNDPKYQNRSSSEPINQSSSFEEISHILTDLDSLITSCYSIDNGRIEDTDENYTNFKKSKIVSMPLWVKEHVQEPVFSILGNTSNYKSVNGENVKVIKRRSGNLHVDDIGKRPITTKKRKIIHNNNPDVEIQKEVGSPMLNLNQPKGSL